MKALILAAGYATRLRPYTHHTPKCLFTIDGRPLIDILIQKLADAGCRELAVNTHHLHQKIERHVADTTYPVAVTPRHEPEILGTAGAIKNLADFWSSDPFVVLNSDILFDIDLAAVYRFHCSHGQPATLVLIDHPPINSVAVDDDDNVVAFTAGGGAKPHRAAKQLTFTGIQVLSAGIIDWIPPAGFCSSIDVYRRMLEAGWRIRAYRADGAAWRDIGTPADYKQAAFEQMAPRAFRAAWPHYRDNPISVHRLAGDGSDRSWSRLTSGACSLVLADHGIRQSDAVAEVDAFVDIGRHLRTAGLPVPTVHRFDRFAGYVFVEDLGDINLQSALAGSAERRLQATRHYRAVIDRLAVMSIRGAEDFDTRWTCQTPRYDENLIRERECRYFMEAFIGGYLNLPERFCDLADEFERIGRSAMETAVEGFVHRDMQSRNIMIKNGQYYFIDFQGGRLGPIQYDLASLLIDPYVDLPTQTAEALLDYAVDVLTSLRPLDARTFRQGYRYCALTRNLQILGAFAYLSRQKNKVFFERFIPAALHSLNRRLADAAFNGFPKLRQLVNNAVERMSP